MSRGGGGGYSIFFRIRRLGPSIYRSPQKNIRNSKHPKKIFEILATQKNIPILYLDLKKDPKMHRNDPQTSPILWWPKKYPQNLHTPKNIHISENPKEYWNSEFWTQKNGPSLRMWENIRVPPLGAMYQTLAKYRCWRFYSWISANSKLYLSK